MISARTEAIAALAARLARRVRSIAAARAENDRRERRRDPSRWRDARLLWPEHFRED
ncbi:hypothetical protein [Aurantiacibacter poecillastricola]|uniref:hypothetical protein n=1 Tax=Aurantiacibacter poecillastricola TaxID=3064385 RepID=UPI00273FF8C5|nr:hypothetical protein [Aurantiacibacter sp. 219JJ12-13]MDP5260310.1 hypothetical protein [Aurantiacibacter sp. 219JJ12-13]